MKKIISLAMILFACNAHSMKNNTIHGMDKNNKDDNEKPLVKKPSTHIKVEVIPLDLSEESSDEGTPLLNQKNPIVQALWNNKKHIPVIETHVSLDASVFFIQNYNCSQDIKDRAKRHAETIIDHIGPEAILSWNDSVASKQYDRDAFFVANNIWQKVDNDCTNYPMDCDALSKLIQHTLTLIAAEKIQNLVENELDELEKNSNPAQ